MQKARELTFLLILLDLRLQASWLHQKIVGDAKLFFVELKGHFDFINFFEQKKFAFFCIDVQKLGSCYQVHSLKDKLLPWIN